MNTFKFILLLVLQLVGLTTKAQDEKKPDRTHQILISFGQSKYHTFNFSKATDYRTYEGTIGWNVTRSIHSPFHLLYGVTFGWKFKRDSYFYYPFPNAPTTKEPYISIVLDRTFSENHHSVINVPLGIGFQPDRSRWSMTSGVQLRQWLGSRGSMDVLRFKNEVGIFGKVYYQIWFIRFGLDVYRSFNDMYHGISLDPISGSRTEPRVKHIYLQGTIVYDLGRRNKAKVTQ